MNILVVSGNLCSEPQVYMNKDGAMQVTFRIAVDRNYKDSATGVRGTDFFQAVAWRDQAKFLSECCHKGDKVTIQGEIQVRQYEKDGMEHRVTEICVNKIEKC